MGVAAMANKPEEREEEPLKDTAGSVRGAMSPSGPDWPMLPSLCWVLGRLPSTTLPTTPEAPWAWVTPTPGWLSTVQMVTLNRWVWLWLWLRECPRYSFRRACSGDTWPPAHSLSLSKSESRSWSRSRSR